MRKSALIFLNHKLSPEQVQQLEEKHRVTHIIDLPSELKQLWANIPADLYDITPLLKPFEAFLNTQAQPNDIVIIQGEMGATFHMVDFCLKRSLLPMYATTQRVTQEVVENGVTQKHSIFKHILFRSY